MSGDQPPEDFSVEEPSDNDPMFQSAIGSGTVDVSLNDDDEDENPFGDEPPTRQKSLTNTTNTVEASSANDENKLFQANTTSVKVDDNDDDLFGVNKPASPAPVSKPSSPAPVSTPSSPKPQEVPSYSADLETELTTSDSQASATKETPAAVSKPAVRRSADDVIEIVVSDPTKAGEVNTLI
jgi:hypothetical protein